MARIILDAGSGNTHKNDWAYAKRIIDELKAVDSGRHEVIIKHQLFTKAGDNIPLDPEIFRKAYHYAAALGYKSTASVFDKQSLSFLLQFNPCLVKIANRRDLDWLVGEVPRKIPLCISYGNTQELETAPQDNVQRLLCVSQYPAGIEDYEDTFDLGFYLECGYGISDHTPDFELWHKYKPAVIEMHYGLEDSTGLDAGPFMRTPTMLKEVL